MEKVGTFWFDICDGREFSYRVLTELWNPAQLEFGERAFARAIAEIQRDVAEGKLPSGLYSYDDLKEANGDAGAYGGLWEREIEEEGARLFLAPDDNDCYYGSLVAYTRAGAVIRQRIDEWLKEHCGPV